MNFENYNLETLKKAVSLYKRVAYPNTDDINNHQILERFKNLENSKSVKEFFSYFKKEMFDGIESYKIQLGSQIYPFLKLAFEKTTFSEDYGFYIDRHSEYIAIDSSSPSYKQELLLKEKTKQLKLQIENLFEYEKIPTYRFFVREYNKRIRNDKTKSKKGKLILLVEDDIDINEMHKIELNLLGYDVESVFNGYDAIKLVENKYFDLMLLDLMMSGISGQEVIKILSKDIDIVVLSALTDSYTKKMCIELGAKAYLSKPVSKKFLETFLDDFFKNKK